MTRKAVVITGNCVNTKQRELFLKKPIFLWCWDQWRTQKISEEGQVTSQIKLGEVPKARPL